MFLTWEACVTHDRCSGQWNMDGCTYVPDLRGLRNTWSLFRPVEHGWLHLCSWPERPAYTWPLFRPVEHGWLHLCSWPKTKRPASYISSVQASGTRMAAPMFLTCSWTTKPALCMTSVTSHPGSQRSESIYSVEDPLNQVRYSTVCLCVFIVKGNINNICK